jgi:SAM-dependent methyltransferase
MCSFSDFSHLELDAAHRHLLKTELDLWHRIYLPQTGLENKTVLDVGAGNGETAQFYLNHGAKHVIAIEPEADLLYRNFGKDERVTIIPLAVGLIKSDCEGGEHEMIVEAHMPVRFVQKHRFAMNCIVYKLEDRNLSMSDMVHSERGFLKEARVLAGKWLGSK